MASMVRLCLVQGSVLGPLLFCIYIRKVPEILKHSMSQLYADDIAFFIIGLDLPAMLQDLQDDLTALAVRPFRSEEAHHEPRQDAISNPAAVTPASSAVATAQPLDL
eukprot:scpid107027/ scgid15409/ 